MNTTSNPSSSDIRNKIALIEGQAYVLLQSLSDLKDALSQSIGEQKKSLPPTKLSRAQLIMVITQHLEPFAPAGTIYKIKDFRDHCEPYYPLGEKDLAVDSDGCPKWWGRFNYAHNQIAEQMGYQRRGDQGLWISR
jgi:hypothetical protein